METAKLQKTSSADSWGMSVRPTTAWPQNPRRGRVGTGSAIPEAEGEQVSTVGREGTPGCSQERPPNFVNALL